MEIAILAGGNSSEHSISVKSGKEIQKWLNKGGYRAHLVILKGSNWIVHTETEKFDVNKNDFSFINGSKKVKFDFAWNIIHGRPGEDGQLQGYLDMMNVPYSSSGLLSSALTFNKYFAKTYLKQFDILSAESVLLKKDQHYTVEDIVEMVSLPCFVKPNGGGSSYATAKITQIEHIDQAIRDALKEDDEVLIESYLKGTELTCGLVKLKDETHIFPLTEIVPKGEFFDYKAKYEGLSEEITPARISEELTRRCKNLASKIYDHTGSKGIVRVDFILKGNQLYFLELNSIPGMTQESIIPQQIKAAGLSVEEILKKVVGDLALD